MFHLILYEPEIPPNTGNIIRLCANTGVGLHLVRPLGFELSDRELRRAGLDYHEYADVQVHDDLSDCLDVIGSHRLFALTTRGATRFTDVEYAAGDVFLLGPETRGLPADVIAALPARQVLRIPLRPGNRSLNLSNAAAVVVYEAWRQLHFAGGS
ncbi:MAG: tRNA (uridine(34)/cytosine(34)/5-carboxymethylaminomethyluridine(34)-2'-O)-methyltransferase TrmL [Gammaproteobacteria bacterium]|nr:tRNA (uridine(34)/cytosine(34)/5-carboxymethylaminomethyluridine(34)-2'-O)-methyltransferase TrmL [Gammaproteobacteria bacterium]